MIISANLFDEPMKQPRQNTGNHPDPLADLERYAALGRACEANGLGWYGEDGQMLFQPPADVIAERAAEAPEQPALNSDELEAAATAVREALSPTIQQAADEIYSKTLDAVQDYLAENTRFNLKSSVDSAWASWRRARAERDELLWALKEVLKSPLAGYAFVNPTTEQAVETAADFWREIERCREISRNAIAKAEGR